MMSKGIAEQIASVTKAFLKIKKFDLAELQRRIKDSVTLAAFSGVDPRINFWYRIISHQGIA